MPAAWRCPVCEGVNHGGRTCTTCGETLPAGFTPEDAAARPAPAPAGPSVVPAPRRSTPRRPTTPSPTEIFGSDPFR